MLKPVDLSYEQAAALPTVGVTAYQATAEVQPGQVVFVNGCLVPIMCGPASRARPRAPTWGSGAVALSDPDVSRPCCPGS